jgi:RHS repeat-associated protein
MRKLFVPISILPILISVSLSVHGQANSSLDSKLALSTDLAVPAGAMPLKLQRKPASTSLRRSPLGAHWLHNWESRLTRNARGIQIEDWAGITSFTEVGKSLAYESRTGEKITITKGKTTRQTANGTLETFDAAGRLLERAYPRGIKISFRYNALGKLSRVEGPGKAALSFVTDASGHVVRVESSSGAEVRYTYDKDDLIEVRINGGAPLRYAYDAKGSLVKIDEPQNGSLEIAYDAMGRVTTYRRADGSEQKFEYDDATNRRRIIAPDGGATVTREDQEKRRTEVTDQLGNKSALQFDEANRPVSITGPTGNSSRLSYDSLGRLVTSEDPLGRVTRYEYVGDGSTVQAIVPPDGNRQEFEYDRDNNLTTIKIGDKIVSALSYNPDGSIASARGSGTKEQKFTYYANGLVQSESNALGETTQFEYDARGNLTRETNPLGGVTIRSFDSQDHLTSLTSPSGETTRYEYDSRGRLNRETDPAGGVTEFEYDVRGRLMAEKDAAGQLTRYEYTPVDQIAKVIHSGNQTELYRYDLAGNLTAQTDILGQTTTFEYDPEGRLSREHRPGGLSMRYLYDAVGSLVSIEESGGAKTEYQTNTSGQTSFRINPSGAKTQYRYDPLGYLTSVTDPLGGIRRFAYTADGDLAEATEPSRDKASYEYDAAGRVIALTRPSGGITHFTYDAMGNLLTATDPLGNVKRYGYDNSGRLLSFTDAANRVTRYSYDNAGRQVGKELPDGKRVTYKYDAIGRVLVVDDGTFPVHISYDEAGHLKQITYAAIKKSISYEYDAQGLRTKLVAPDGREIRYEYDEMKRVSGLVLPDGKKIAFSFDEMNRVQSVLYPNGLAGRWTYNSNGQLEKVDYRDSRNKTVAGSSYRYDATGNAVERKDAQGQTSRFTYDPAGQILEETTREGAIKYSYGAGGNRARVQEGKLVREYKHNAADQLIQAGTDLLSYDADGNLISRKTTTGTTVYEYDLENRLVKTVMPDGASTTYGYAPTGERVWRRDAAGTTYFLYDGLNLIAELDSELRTSKMFVHGLGIDRPLVMLQSKETYYYVADRSGSVTHLFNAKGEVAASYAYDAFGKMKTRQRTTIANPFAYTGRELDPTGLYYYRARYYDATLGRFLSNDLIGARLDQPLQQNPYLYVRNNPVQFVDPFGLDPYTPESLADLTDGALQQLFIEAAKDPTKQLWPIYAALRARATPKRINPFRFEAVPQPDGSTEWEARRADGSALPMSEPAPPRQQVVGRPGQAGPSNANPNQTDAVPAPRGNPTGAVNGGSANRAGANTNAIRPQPGAPGSNTQQVGDARAGGNTMRVSPANAPGAGNDFWTLNPKTIRPGISTAGSVAGLIATAADCYRNGLSNCGPKIVQGVVIGGIATAVIGKAAGPIGTLIAGGKAWWEIDKELTKGNKDQQQKDEQTKARDAQTRVNLNNRDAFYPRIEQLRDKINELKKQHDTIVKNTPEAERQMGIAAQAAAAAHQDMKVLEALRGRKQDPGAVACELIKEAQPVALKNEIDALAQKAEAKQRESDRLLKEGRQMVANCGSPADASAIRERYNTIKSLHAEIPKLKLTADQKQAKLEQVRKAVANLSKGQLAADSTASSADHALEADNAAKEAERLVTQIRDAISVLVPAEKQLRQEINALHSAVPETVLAGIQDRFNELHALLSSYTNYPPLVRYDDEALASAREANLEKARALQMLENSKVTTSCSTDIPSVDAAMQRINTAVAMIGLDDPGDLLRLSAGCEASAKCIPVINQARDLIQQLKIEEGEAAINQARQEGCTVTGLETTLDYYRSIRDGAALLFNAKDQCKFQDGLALAQKMPQSIQNNPWIANGIDELRTGLAAQQQVEQYIARASSAFSKASTSASKAKSNESGKLSAEADGYIAQADQLAKPYPCLLERVNRAKDESKKLRDGDSDQAVGVEEIPEDAVKTPTGRDSSGSAANKQAGSSEKKPKTPGRGNSTGGTTKTDGGSREGLGGLDLSGTYTAQSQQDGYSVNHVLVLKRTAANEWQGTWGVTGGAPFTEGTKPRSTEPQKVKLVADGNGKGHYFTPPYTWTYDFTYKANQIVMPYSNETGPVTFTRQ